MSVVEDDIIRKFVDQLLEDGQVHENLVEGLGQALSAERAPKADEIVRMILVEEGVGTNDPN
jgi:hypothetical protein